MAVGRITLIYANYAINVFRKEQNMGPGEKEHTPHTCSVRCHRPVSLTMVYLLLAAHSVLLPSISFLLRTRNVLLSDGRARAQWQWWSSFCSYFPVQPHQLVNLSDCISSSADRSVHCTHPIHSPVTCVDSNEHVCVCAFVVIPYAV